MNYKLAKELKDAGFPVEWFIFSWRYPTLSELIEACGDEFLELLKGYRTAKDYPFVGWKAWSTSEAAKKRDNDDDGYIAGRGKTPEEAVARLWLALNKK